MKIELHMIQNFAPSCLNRDDTNSPKDCVFGGVRRARVSSQCIKRAIRNAFREDELLPAANLAQRTKRLAEVVADRLASQGKNRDLAQAAVATALGGLGFGVDDQGQTQYLVFLGESGIDALTDLCSQHWDKLAEVAENIRAAEQEGTTKSAKDAKKAAKDAVPKEIRQSLAPVLDGSKTADLALFGRMLADLPGENIDAACQVAHAISTNRVEFEMDFYTAVDDLKSDEEDAGAGMMGTIGYNSPCFYRYAVIDFEQLLKNLGDDRELAEKTVEAFLRASATAIPSGKQNTFAAHSMPDLIGVDVRHSGPPMSLANAFAGPVRPADGANLTQSSVNQLADYWSRLTGVYGTDGMDGPRYCGPTEPAEDTGWQDAKTLNGLIDWTMQTIRNGGGS